MFSIFKTRAHGADQMMLVEGDPLDAKNQHGHIGRAKLTPMKPGYAEYFVRIL